MVRHQDRLRFQSRDSIIDPSSPQLNTNYGAVLALLTLAISIHSNTARNSNSPSYQWTAGNFHFPCPSTKSLLKSSGKYIPRHVISTRAQMSDDDVFVAFPRYKPGTPATLAKASLNSGCCDLKFEAFPCWPMQEEGNCNSLQSVVDLVVDQNDILWVLDTGILNTLSDPERKCPPKVVAFNAKTGRLLRSITLTDLVNAQSRLQYLAVDHSPGGRCFLYISDAATRAVIVYDVQAGRGYRLLLPKAVTIGGSKRDVLYLALVRRSCGTSVLYFTYLGSTHLFAIRTEYLQTGDTSGRVTDIGVKKDRIIIVGTDNGSVIFFRYEGESDIYQYDTNTCFKEENLKVVHKGSNCLLATHAIADYRNGRMRVLESNFPDYMNGHVGCGAVQQINYMQGCD